MTVAVIEAGGTKIVCAVGSTVEELRTTRDRCVVETGLPADTVPKMERFFRGCRSAGAVDRVGVATFGPVDLRTGVIGATPKPGWRGFGWREFAADLFPGARVAIDTDVNAAALAEARHGASRGTAVSVYVTVGTGVGAGVVVDGHPLRGLGHPEVGHLRVPRVPGDDFPGICPFHGDCLEGLASGRALEVRAGAPAETLGADSRLWDLEARYLGAAVNNLVAVVSPERIVVGGGVTKQRALLDLVRHHAATYLGAYWSTFPGPSELAAFVVAPELGGDAGIVGALELTRPGNPG